MPCYKPLRAWQRHLPGSTGKKPVSFTQKDFSEGSRIQLPCGQCIGCRLERSRQWAVRITHEASLQDHNAFLTLTYKETPPGDSLNLYDITTFLKRLRKAISPLRIRFFQCGEYGSKGGRPHHHVCLFGYDFPDRWLWKPSDSMPLYRSEELERLWPHGLSSIGALTFESAAYVSRYVTKKVTGARASKHYDGRKPEFVTMSRRPGIGQGWYRKWKGDIYPSDLLIIRGGKRSGIPRYYDNQLQREDPVLLEQLKEARKQKATTNPNNAPAVMRQRHAFRTVRQRQLQRSYEDQP